MAHDRFDSMYRGLRNWSPNLPIFLAKQMIRDRYRDAAERRQWSSLRAEAEFILNAAKEGGTVAVTRSSATVTGTGTNFQSADVGRQFMVGSRAPVYSISAVANTTSMTIDRVYGDVTNATATYRILDAYVTCPADFRHFIVVYDPRQNWRLRHYVTQDDISRLDPARTSAGTPWALIDRRFSTLTATLGRATYELWPYTTNERNYPFYYEKEVTDLVDDDDTPDIPIRGDVLVRGALADLVRWPGTRDNPNPMYDPKNTSWQQEYEVKIAELERTDEDLYMTWLTTNDWASWPLAPLDSKFLQQHA